VTARRHLARVPRAWSMGLAMAVLSATALVGLSASAGADGFSSSVVAYLPTPGSALALDSQGYVCVTGGVLPLSPPQLRTHVVSGQNIPNQVLYSVDPGGNVTPFDSLPSGWITAAVTGPDGNLYVADSNREEIEMVAPDGTVSTVATWNFPGLATQINFGPDGRLYVGLALPAGNGINPFVRSLGQLRSLTPTAHTIWGSLAAIMVVQGGALVPISGLEGDGPAFAFDHSGILHTLSGDGSQFLTYSVVGMTASPRSAVDTTLDEFVAPWAMALGGSGDVYITDPSISGVIWQYAPTGAFLDALGSEYYAPMGIEISPQGRIYVMNFDGGSLDLTYLGAESSSNTLDYFGFPCSGVQAPTAPVNLTVTRHYSTVTATWLPDPGATFLCTLVAGGTTTSITVLTALDTCTFSNLNPAGAYAVRVQAQTPGGVSPIAQKDAPPPLALHYTCVKGHKHKHLVGYARVCPYGWHVL
jgi:hypothetical protein